MNERIKALALQAGWEPYEETSLSGRSKQDETFQAGEYPVGEDLSRFAELILILCADICQQEATDNGTAQKIEARINAYR
jgi:hypothetical protein